MADEILTDAAAEFLGVTKVAIYKLIREEKIKAEKKGRDFRVDMDSLKEYKKNVARQAGRLGQSRLNRQGTGLVREKLPNGSASTSGITKEGSGQVN